MSEEFIERDENSSEDASPRERRSRLQAGPEAGTRSRLLRNPAKGGAGHARDVRSPQHPVCPRQRTFCKLEAHLPTSVDQCVSAQVPTASFGKCHLTASPGHPHGRPLPAAALVALARKEVPTSLAWCRVACPFHGHRQARRGNEAAAGSE